MVVGIEGHNPSGNCLVASKLVDSIPPTSIADDKDLNPAKKLAIDKSQPIDITSKRIELSMAYVTQDDNLIGTLTVKETISYSAQLWLSDKMAPSDKEALVESTIVVHIPLVLLLVGIQLCLFSCQFFTTGPILHLVLRRLLDFGKKLPIPDALLINGQRDSAVFTSQAGKTYKFRVSNVGLRTSINLRIQGHSLKLIEVEGAHTLQDTYESLDIHVGQSVV
ncbi:hypothetical protein HN51_044634 [Arachis hypogaea]